MTNSLDNSKRETLIKSEYAQLATIMSQGYQSMALLLTLYFIFNGAIFAFLAQMITSQWGSDKFSFISGTFTISEKEIIVGFCAVVSILFTIWSYYFVSVFSDNLRITLKRGSEIEREHDGYYGVYSRYMSWLDSGRSRRGLSISTMLFFLTMFAFWVSIIAMVAGGK
jgi:hypothetical protein